MLTDQELVASYRARGDQAAFHALYQRHAGRVFGLVLRLSGYRESEAEEVAQEAWVRAVERLGTFRWESSFSTWVCGIAILCWRERTRRRRAGDVSASEPITHAEPDVDLASAIAQLPRGAREVLILHDVEGYTHKEIGAALGIEEGTSKSQLFHARRALRERLGSRQHFGSQQQGTRSCQTNETT